MARGATIVFTNPVVYISTSTAIMSTATASSTVANLVPYNLSEWFRQITLDISADEKEDTTFGLTAKSRVQGLFDWGFEAEALTDYASTGITMSSGGSWSFDGLMYDLLNNKVKFNIAVRPNAGVVRSSDNPEYGGPVRLFTHRGVGGAIGDVLVSPRSFKGSGNFTRTVSAT
jgi:hypothetical protein